LTADLQPNLVTTDSELLHVCERLAAAGCFAFDTEFIMEDAYRSQVCLIQTATDTEVALIDPLAGLDSTPFWNLVADPSFEVVVHAGAEDFGLCLQALGKPPSNVFDVQIAAGLVTCDYPLSLARLARNLLSVRLHKSQTLTDWRKRPLSPAQRRYASEDVVHIPAIHKWLKQRLAALGRTDWAREEFARFESVETYQPPKQDRVLRVKGAGSLDRAGLAILSELLDAREQLAEEYNRPVRAILRDHLLIELARHRWTEPEEIRALRGLHLRSSSIQRIAAAVKRALARPQEQWPALRRTVEPPPEEPGLVALLTAVLRDYCLANDLAFSWVATKEAIQQLVRAHLVDGQDVSPLVRGWRSRAIAPMLRAVLAGQLAVRVVGEGGRVRLAVNPFEATFDPHETPQTPAADNADN